MSKVGGLEHKKRVEDAIARKRREKGIQKKGRNTNFAKKVRDEQLIKEYPSCESDYELMQRMLLSKKTVKRIREHYNLPIPSRLDAHDRKMYAEKAMRQFNDESNGLLLLIKAVEMR